MASRAVAKRLRQGEYEIKCPQCSRKHLLSHVAFNKFELNSDPDDTFTAHDNGAAVSLHPIFVCRNNHCRFEGDATFAPHAV